MVSVNPSYLCFNPLEVPTISFRKNNEKKKKKHILTTEDHALKLEKEKKRKEKLQMKNDLEMQRAVEKIFNEFQTTKKKPSLQEKREKKRSEMRKTLRDELGHKPILYSSSAQGGTYVKVSKPLTYDILLGH